MLEHGLQHADDRAVRAVFAFGKPAQAVEVTEELVSAVDEVNDHFAVNEDFVAAPAKPGGALFKDVAVQHACFVN